MATCQLGNLKFRIEPDDVSYDYHIDYSVIDTLGGQVIQVLGATIGDLKIRGSFGQDHKNRKNSWELAESFHASIRAMMDAQSLPRNGASHTPIRFTYMDGVHDWNFKVLIKDVVDPDGQGSIDHSNGKFAYRYELTLFIVEDASLKLKKITTDKFIARIANGMGWKASGFNGSASLIDAIRFITDNSTDGTFDGYIVNLLEGKTPAPVQSSSSQGRARTN